MNKRKRMAGGPRSAAGKAIASRNALRHGFAATRHQRAADPERIERLGRAIAGADDDPTIVAQAFKIAQNELLLSEIALHKVWVVERLRERYAVPFAEKDNTLQLGHARLLQMWLIEREIKARLPEVLRDYESKWIEEEITRSSAELAASIERDPCFAILHPDKVERAGIIKGRVEEMASRVTAKLKGSDWRKMHDDIVPIRLKAMLEEPEEDKPAQAHAAKARRHTDWDDRNDEEAMEAAVKDLVRLDRYERRAWSRQKRAILQLANIKLSARSELPRPV